MFLMPNAELLLVLGEIGASTKLLHSNTIDFTITGVLKVLFAVLVTSQ